MRAAIKKKNPRFKVSHLGALLFVIAFVAGSSILLLTSHAATPYASSEAESGTLASGAAAISDSSSSGGSAIKFEGAMPSGSYFTLSPASGSYAVGNTLTVTLTEISSSAATTNGVQANLSYPTALLQYQSTTLMGPFSVCAQNTGGNGLVNIGCASSAAESGTQPIAQITFSVLGTSGSAAIDMIAGTDIQNQTGTSIWNGVLPDAYYSL